MTGHTAATADQDETQKKLVDEPIRAGAESLPQEAAEEQQSKELVNEPINSGAVSLPQEAAEEELSKELVDEPIKAGTESLPQEAAEEELSKELVDEPIKAGTESLPQEAAEEELSKELVDEPIKTGTESLPQEAADSTDVAGATAASKKAEQEELSDVQDGDIPSPKKMAAAKNVKVVSGDAKLLKFSELYEGKSNKIMIIFIRHFYCGLCQNYVENLVETFPKDVLAANNAEIHIIGCGSAELIPKYIQMTGSNIPGCHFPFYADHSTKLYDALGLGQTLSMGDSRPSYQKKSVFGNALSSIKQALSSGSLATKGGDFKQLGGEFLFEDGKCTWAHIMHNTRDHADVSEIEKVLEIDRSKKVVPDPAAKATEEAKDVVETKDDDAAEETVVTDMDASVVTAKDANEAVVKEDAAEAAVATEDDVESTTKV